MDTVFWLIIGFCFVGIWLCLRLLERNEEVCGYLLGMVDLIHESNVKDIEDGDDRYWDQRYDLLNSKSQGWMVILFWIPLDKFYKDIDFKFRGV
jgi:hypothetical protein